MNPLTPSEIDALATFLLSWAVLGPFVGAGLVAAWYEWRYRKSLTFHRQMENNLFRE